MMIEDIIDENGMPAWKATFMNGVSIVVGHDGSSEQKEKRKAALEDTVKDVNAVLAAVFMRGV